MFACLIRAVICFLVACLTGVSGRDRFLGSGASDVHGFGDLILEI